MEITEHIKGASLLLKHNADHSDFKKPLDQALNLEEENKKLKQELSEATAKINWFTEQFRLMQARKFGRSTEQSSVIQFDWLPETLEEASATEPEEDKSTGILLRKTKSQGRRIDTSKLQRGRIVHDLPEACCPSCQGDVIKMGEDVAEQLEYIPGSLKVIEHVRIKYSCRPCDTIKMAEKPPAPVPKCMAGASLLTEVILSKYQRHIPMYRQSQILLSEGIDIPANTLVNWGLSLYEVLAPLAKAMWEQLKNTDVLQADDTRVKMLATDKQGFMWCYRSCDPEKRYVIFSYNESRAGKVPSEHLKDFKGILQTDGYSGFNELRIKPGIINIGCFAHCRRKFVEVIKVSGNATGKANEAVKIIEKLYEIEREAKGLGFSERYALRQEKSKPILEGFNQWLKSSAEKVGTKSKLSQAVHYALNQWEYLSAYINHGEVEIDNNGVENQIRPFALGRKNWLFVGNQKGADASALFYSLIQTCILNEIEPRKYFNYLLRHVKEMRVGTIEAKDLLPQNIDVRKLSD
jgi:transposase